MNSNDIAVRRNQTLILVEGKHEKTVFFKLLTRCFPEINIRYENIHVYNTNIYDLYDAIVREYNNPAWYEDEDEINLPLLVSKRENLFPRLNKRNFSNIFLIFDYDCQDGRFSQEKIERMQKYFCSAIDDGMLFINYPMVEAYKDMPVIPDPNFYLKKYHEISGLGSVYKNMVHQDSEFERYISLYNKVIRYFCNQNLRPAEAECLAEQVFSMNLDCNLEDNICKIIEVKITPGRWIENAKYYLSRMLSQNVESNMTYWGKLRKLLLIIAGQNICKGYMIQEQQQEIPVLTSELYKRIDYLKILDEQNRCSCLNGEKYVWVLSTCICILGEYKFFWK